MKESLLVALSGGFDPLHAGHLEMINNAAKIGNVVVILNTDEWLIRKKGFVFQSFQDRRAILINLVGVTYISKAKDKNNTVEETLRDLRPDIFVNGGDRKEDNTPEMDVCKELGIEMRFNVGGGKLNHSSGIATRGRVERLWGSYTVIDEGPDYKVKKLEIKPGSPGSLQRHNHRREVWIDIDTGVVENIPIGQAHDIINNSSTVKRVIEIQLGIDPSEDDIERISKNE